MEVSRNEPGSPGRRVPVAGWLVFAVLLVGGYALLGDHRSHAVALLPYLILLACPLMHLFHRHGSHRHLGEHPERKGSKTV